MKLEYLWETPQKIGNIPSDHTLNNRAGNAQLAYKFLEDDRKVLIKSLADGVDLFQLPVEYVVIDQRQSPPKVIYYVKYEIQNLGYIGARAACQVLVWRSIYGGDLTQGLPKQIFFDFILPKTGTIVTDYLQSDDGERFWGYRVDDVLRLGKFVYYVNFQPDRVIKQITSLDELNDIRKEVWGDHQKFRQRRVIITNKQLNIVAD